MGSIDFQYQCSSPTTCNPIKFTFIPGKYLVELWGAQGGNTSHGEKGGKGGYASGVLTFRSKSEYFLFLGSQGSEGTGASLTNTAFNGGGRGYYRDSDHSATAGGGGTDLRKSHDVNSRIIVAGGGSGASYFVGVKASNGSCGGGFEGGPGSDSFFSVTYPGGGAGKQGSGGSSNKQQGKFGYGGNQTTNNHFGSGGGGGWWGGGAGSLYASTGGGGSGNISTEVAQPVLRSGCGEIPSFYFKGKSIGHTGQGAARITFLVQNSQRSRLSMSISFLFAMQLLLC